MKGVLFIFVFTCMVSFGLAADIYKVNIYKSDYRLEVLKNDFKIYSFPCVFGDPIGDKYKQGDRKTPVGSFRIQAKYPHKSWAYFMWLDYPNTTSYKRYNDRKQKGLIKNNEAIGGSIGIHGVPDGLDFYISGRVNWTLGCIALSRKNIATLYNLVPVGTEVLIYE